MVIWNSKQLIQVCDAEHTQTNVCIAQTIINVYNNAKNFYQDDLISCFKEFLKSGNLDFRKHNIEF